MQRFHSLIKMRVADPRPRGLLLGVATSWHPSDDIQGECQWVQGQGRLGQRKGAPAMRLRRPSVAALAAIFGRRSPCNHARGGKRRPSGIMLKDWSGERILRLQKARSTSRGSAISA
jgi:hypothetical protein